SDAGAGGPLPKLPPQRRRLLAYLRVPGQVRFVIDPNVYQDTACTLLPEIGAYGAGIIDHLFRTEIQLELDGSGGAATVRVSVARGAVTGGDVRLYADDAAGNRRPFATVPASADGARVSVPTGARRIAAVLRGSVSSGDLVAVSEALIP